MSKHAERRFKVANKNRMYGADAGRGKSLTT
jgi:hypothetical protein